MTRKNPPIRGEDVRTSAVVQGTGEGGGGERDGRRKKNYRIRTFGDGIIGGGAVFYWADPRPSSSFQVLPSAQSGSKASSAEEKGQEESGASIQTLDGAFRRRADSEVSLLLTGREALEPSGSGGAARDGDIRSA